MGNAELIARLNAAARWLDTGRGLRPDSATFRAAAAALSTVPPRTSLADKMRAVDLTIAALEGEEIVWPDHKILRAAASVARRYAQMLESE